MNTNDSRFDWMRQYAEGTANAETTAMLEQALRDDAEFRALFVEYLNVDLALSECSVLRPSLQPTMMIHCERRAIHWLQWRPLWAAAAGIVFGMFCTSLVYAHFTALTAVVVSLTNAGFESRPEPTSSGIAAVFDRWGGDLCRVVPAEQGITPHEGARMLRFLSAVSQGAPEAKDFTVADQWLLLDVRALPLQDNARTIALSAWFNRTADATAANNRFGVGLYAFQGTAADGPQLWHSVKTRALAFAETEVPTDSDPATWERGETRLTIPAHANLLLLRIHAFKQHWQDSATPELIGHYADDVRLEIIPAKHSLP